MPVLNQNKLVAGALSGHVSVSTGPTDVCKTPSPGGPVPVPYPNAAPAVAVGPGYTTKTLLSGGPLWTKKGKAAMSSGDQPGVLLGIVSNRVMGMCEVRSASNDVKAEGGALARTLDATNGNV